ncbi:GNAT family N-acetyltransferase [Nocardioides sp. GXZ039]|uniref:GNAT family N-acetyltransferase n=1 Tax=Nocardioides sp. GXZ039 TaxID=3136018 RepID=UPI0030F407C5
MSDLSLHLVPDADTTALIERMRYRRYLGEYADPDLAHAAATAYVERVGPRTRGYEIRDGAGSGVAWLWWSEDGPDRAVLDLRLDHAEDAARVRELAVELARSEGAGRLTIGVTAGDLVAEAFVVGGGFEVAATQMRLDLDHALPEEDAVVLAGMDHAAYDAWVVDQVATYAEERAQSGESPERAREVSEQQFADLLPDGLETEHHHFFVGRVGEDVVGTLWIGTERPMAFVYDVAVDPAHRRKGYGAGLMRAGALWSRERGAHALGLNVFGHNHGARALYDRLGYLVVETYLGRRL